MTDKCTPLAYSWDQTADWNPSPSWGRYLAAGAQRTIRGSDGSLFIVRLAREADRKALCEVCLKTGDSGKDASGLYQDPCILGERWVLPYLELQPAFAYVLEDTRDSSVVGYALGCLNTQEFEERLVKQYLPRMQEKHCFEKQRGQAAPLSADDVIRREFQHFDKTPECVYMQQDCPSHLHIDLLPRCQGLGLGRPFLAVLLRALRDCGSMGVHLEMSGANSRAAVFYARLGFSEAAVLDGETREVLRASCWKFLPVRNHSIVLDSSKIVYLKMNLASGEDKALATDWDPARKVIEGTRVLKSFFHSNKDLSGVSADVRPLVCTAPEPWETVRQVRNHMR